ncbi:hypothetical protein C3L33_00441, partial [Rhododendron williamsianum]
MERYKVTYGPFVPPIVLAVAKCEKTDDYDLSAVRMVQSGAAPLGKEVEEAVRAKFRNATLVAPAELEALLLNHPEISDAAVVGMKDESAGEVPVAFVVKSNGSKITEEEVKQYISKQVVFYKRISRVFFNDAIPKAPSGKILRKDLRAKLAAGLPN